MFKIIEAANLDSKVTGFHGLISAFDVINLILKIDEWRSRIRLNLENATSAFLCPTADTSSSSSSWSAGRRLHGRVCVRITISCSRSNREPGSVIDGGPSQTRHEVVRKSPICK